MCGVSIYISKAYMTHYCTVRWSISFLYALCGSISDAKLWHSSSNIIFSLCEPVKCGFPVIYIILCVRGFCLKHGVLVEGMHVSHCLSHYNSSKTSHPTVCSFCNFSPYTTSCIKCSVLHRKTCSRRSVWRKQAFSVGMMVGAAPLWHCVQAECLTQHPGTKTLTVLVRLRWMTVWVTRHKCSVFPELSLTLLNAFLSHLAVIVLLGLVSLFWSHNIHFQSC